jgi:hypothetical protein
MFRQRFTVVFGSISDEMTYEVVATSMYKMQKKGMQCVQLYVR